MLAEAQRATIEREREDLILPAERWAAMSPRERFHARLEGFIPGVGGGSPVGVSGMGFQHNLPAPGSFVENSDAFFTQTERNDIPGPSQPYPGLGGGGVDVRIPQVGLLAGIRVIFNGTLTVAGA